MKSISVMGISYEIIQLLPDDLFKLYENSQHEEALTKLFGEKCINFSGLCDAQNQKIYLNIKMTDEKKEKTFMHEYVEAMDQECCLELGHIEMQAIANSFFLSGIIDVKELLKNEPEDIEISIAGDTAG
jgi:hypothetical protein